MQIPTLLVVFFAFSTAALAAPLPGAVRRANAAVFTTQPYDEPSISGGTAGDAQAQALARFSALDMNDLANVAASDLAFVQSVHDIANDAETEAFNVAIKAATGDAKTALQVCGPIPLCLYPKLMDDNAREY